MKRLNAEGTLVAASEAFGSGASWAPDGGRVAFAAFDTADGGFTSASRAYVADVSTGTATPITDTTTYMTSAHWSPDGTWIAFDIGDSNGATRDVWLSRPDGSERHRVARFPGGSCCAVWSPDSNWLLAQGSDADGGGLFILGLDGSVARLASVDDPNDLRFYSWGGWASQP
jgi:Tol biopolymer transport system component